MRLGGLELGVLWTWCFIGLNFLFYLPGEIHANPTFVMARYAEVLNWFVIGYCYFVFLFTTTLIEF